MFYSSIAAESLRICRATTTSNNASLSVQALVKRMDKQGGDMLRMKHCIKRMVNRHQINLKFGLQGDEFVNKIFMPFG